ncbi:PAS domain-containing protein [Desulfococcaceae bacterium HSG8]|nr:PAS domain-containing protein [Desulfococcaceae bacterium HSG8]
MIKKRTCEELEQEITKLEREIAKYKESETARVSKQTDALKRKTEIVDKNKARYRGIFQHTKNGIAVYEAADGGNDFVFSDINKAGEEIDRIKRKDVIGRSVLEIFPGIRDSGLYQAFRRVWKTGIPEYPPAYMIKDEGVRGWRENFIYKLPSGEIVSIYNDKTKEKEAEDALKKSEECLRQSEAQKKAILDGITTNISFIDENMEILWVNKAAADSFKKKPGEMIGYKCHELWSGLKKYCEDCPIVKSFNTRKTEQSIICTSDGRIWNRKGEPVSDEEGEMIGAVEIAEDITDKVRLEAQLEQAQKMEAIGSLAGGIAHQFNNALFGITGSVELLRMALSDNEKTSKYIQSISDSAQRMTELTRQLTAYVHGGKYQPKIISLNDFIEDSLPLIRHTVNPSIRIIKDLKTGIHDIKADIHQMRMVLSAVISNSAEAIGEQGCIHITTGNLGEHARIHPELRSGHYIFLSVEDDGKGMDEETKLRIFEPFFTTNPQKKRGLSMAAAYGIINDHGGWISVNSELGKGTVVHVCMPAVN